MSADKKPEISVVIPIYNEEANIPSLLQRIVPVMEGTKRDYEIVFVDDGSRDRSLALLIEAQKKNPNLVVVEFNRNFGQHSAVFGGFETSRGDLVITIDADLQNPPEEIPKIIAKYDEGYDCIATVRMNRQDTQFRKSASKLVNKLTRRMTGIQLHDYGCMLRGYGRDVVNAMIHTKEISTFIPALGASYARKLVEIDVAHAERAAGESKYNFYKLISLQFDLLTSFSIKPIRALSFIGLGISTFSILFALYIIAMRLIMGPDWAATGVFTLFAILFFFVGVQFVVLGLLGEYIGRIYMEVRDRPRFIIRKVYRGN